MNRRRPARADRPALPVDPAQVKARLQADLPRLLAELHIEVRRPGDLNGAVLHTKNPRRPGSEFHHFAIWLKSGADGVGSWKDFGAGGDPHGDIYGLIQYLEGLDRWIDAYWWALKFLGLEAQKPRSAKQAKLDQQKADAERRALELKAQADESRRRTELFRWWVRLPAITGTLAEVYLREARGIPLERIGAPKHRLGALRYCEALEHVDGDGVVTTWPAMVAAMTLGPEVIGLHKTWLRRDGLGKAPVDVAKKMTGKTRGAAIRLTPGPSGLSPSVAAKKGVVGPLAVGEGIETSLSVAAAMPSLRVWAAGSLAHIGLVDWPDCASGVILLRDNDAKPAAVQAFDQALAHWKRQARGRPIEVVASDRGKDFNDWLRGAA